MTNLVHNRYEFVYLFDVENGNPNGDPDAGNMPRIDPDTGLGLVTDVCLKRKIRNYVHLVKSDQSPYCIYVKEKAILTIQQKRAYQSLLIDDKKRTADDIEKARHWMCQNFFDIRTFGAVMSLKEYNCGQVRGPVQLNFAQSIDVILPKSLTITRMAIATEKEAKGQSGHNRTMGHKNIVPYALYRAEGFISANLAQQTGFNEDDLSLFWDAIINMFDHDRSAAKGKMCPRRLVVFRHDRAIGNAPAHKLLETVKIQRCGNKHPRSFDEYEDAIVSPKDGPLVGFKGVNVLNLL